MMNPRATAATFLERARLETGPQHTELEQVIGLESICASEADYRRSLRAFLGIWAPLEGLLAQSPLAKDAALELPARIRTLQLRDDLQLLGDSHAQVEALPQAPLPWSALSRAEAAGVLYVLEGSTHGGKIIGKVLEKRLGITPIRGGSFFAGHGERNAELWKGFVQWTTTALDDTEVPIAAEASRQTFQAMIDWFRDQLHREQLV